MSGDPTAGAPTPSPGELTANQKLTLAYVVLAVAMVGMMTFLVSALRNTPQAGATSSASPDQPSTGTSPNAGATGSSSSKTLKIVRVRQLPADDPDAPIWDGAPPCEVSLGPQTFAMPTQTEVVIPALEVKAATDGDRVAFRVSWNDTSADWNVDTGRFCDAVALGFPLDSGAPPMMGAKDLRMQILYWKALWQKDVDYGFQDVQDVHPNYWSDLYWFAEGQFPYPVPESFKNPTSKQWFPAHQAGNPMANFSRTQPVQELVAEGWGSLTHQDRSISTARGLHRDGRWTIVISRPLLSDDPLDFQFRDAKGQIAFAAWDGAKAQRGARKQWSLQWVEFEMLDHVEAQVPRLIVTQVQKLDAPDPVASYWRDAPSVSISVLPQQMAMPQLAKPTITEVRAQAVTDGKTITFRLDWYDKTQDWNVDTGRFCDAVAIGFPLDTGAPPMMGAKDLRIQILYWKALWQKDIDEGFQDVQDLHPNYWSDLYWFAEGEFPYPVPEAFKNPTSKQWFPAHQAGNPMANFSRKVPVQELVAEGWGSLTNQKLSISTGRGVWKDRRWLVAFSRPLTTNDPLDFQFAQGTPTQVVVAAWNGSDANRGGRKHWSTWVNLEFAGANK